MTKDEFPLGEVKRWSWATTYEKECCKLPGVKSAVADMGRKVLHVEYDENNVDRAAIEDKLDEVQQRFMTKGFTN